MDGHNRIVTCGQSSREGFSWEKALKRLEAATLKTRKSTQEQDLDVIADRILVRRNGTIIAVTYSSTYKRAVSSLSYGPIRSSGEA